MIDLGTAQIESSPFLGKREGIYAADISFIPEKYRLDVARAEKILQGALLQWLKALKNPGERLRPQETLDVPQDP